MERNLPATPDEARPDADPEQPMEAPPRPVSVAFLPLALISFLILAFTIAAWTFLHAVL
jgi:hypothetical protein